MINKALFWFVFQTHKFEFYDELDSVYKRTQSLPTAREFVNKLCEVEPRPKWLQDLITPERMSDVRHEFLKTVKVLGK